MAFFLQSFFPPNANLFRDFTESPRLSGLVSFSWLVIARAIVVMCCFLSTLMSAARSTERLNGKMMT